MQHNSPFSEARQLATSGKLKIEWSDRLAHTPTQIPEHLDLADKIDGMILGLAIGDALGNTTESRNPTDRRRAFGWIDGYLPNPHAGGLRVGLPSDDTQMTARTIEQLLEVGRLDPHLLGNLFCADRIFGLGSSVREFIGRYKSGAPWFLAGANSAGNGALMRIAPVVLPYLRAPNCDMWADALMAGHLTHNDWLSNSSCVALVHVLWQLLGRTVPPESDWWISEWSTIAQEVSPDSCYASRNDHPPGFNGTISGLLSEYVLPALERDLPVDEACDIWHSGAYLLETVPSVLYILARHGDDPRTALLEAVNNTRDNDTIGAIVGAAVGALHGASALPAEWVSNLLGRTRANDDHHLFGLLEQSAERFGYRPRLPTVERARMARPESPSRIAIDLASGQPLKLGARGYWIKIVGFMVHTWAVIQVDEVTGSRIVWFFDDLAKVFDVMVFSTTKDAERGLRRNGFEPFDSRRHGSIESPIASEGAHHFQWRPRRIYSSGLYWING